MPHSPSHANRASPFGPSCWQPYGSISYCVPAVCDEDRDTSADSPATTWWIWGKHHLHADYTRTTLVGALHYFPWSLASSLARAGVDAAPSSWPSSLFLIGCWIWSCIVMTCLSCPATPATSQARIRSRAVQDRFRVDGTSSGDSGCVVLLAEAADVVAAAAQKGPHQGSMIASGLIFVCGVAVLALDVAG